MAGAGGPTPDSLAATGTEEARTPVSRFLAELRQRHGMVGRLSRSKLAAVVEEEPAAGDGRSPAGAGAAQVASPDLPAARPDLPAAPPDLPPADQARAASPDLPPANQARAASPELPPPNHARAASPELPPPDHARAATGQSVPRREVSPSDKGRPDVAPVPELVVAAGGNLALVYFPRHSGRLTAEEIEAAYPGLLAGIVDHPGVGFVCTRTSPDGPVVLGRNGVRHLVTGLVTGEDPLAAFGPEAAADLLQHDRCDHLGDLVVNSRLDAATNEVAAFEELVGCHGGLGGWQGQAVLVHPAGWPVAEDLVGAESVHRQLVRWLERAGHRGDLIERAAAAAGV